MSVEVIEPGLVLIKNAVSAADQIKHCRAAMECGNDPDFGFWEEKPDALPRWGLNSTTNRGRIYDRISRFPARFLQLCRQLVATSTSADAAMPPMEPTHMLLLYYAGFRGMGFHRDEGENDGTSDAPVVSVSFGNACTFGFKHQRDDEVRTVELESGDALLFGGPCRMMLHSVLQVHQGTKPHWLKSALPAEVRLNFTFRCAPEAVGREHTDFKFFKPGSRHRDRDRSAKHRLQDSR
jgi:alkylated DNA repair dioxygenase AlkB